MQIHISQTTKDHLEHDPYIIEERGKIFVKVGPSSAHSPANENLNGKFQALR